MRGPHTPTSSPRPGRGRAPVSPWDAGLGSATAVGIIGMTLLAGVGVMTVGSASVAAHRARTAADLAALAAAQVAVGARDVALEPCLVASDVVARHRARLQSCRVTGVTVEIVTTAGTGIGWMQARGSARAGPRDPPAAHDAPGPRATAEPAPAHLRP